MKKMMTRYIMIPVEKLCEAKYYVKVEPFNDPHFRPEPSYVLDNRYFDTQEEAETYKQEQEKERVFFARLTICEKITELE